MMQSKNSDKIIYTLSHFISFMFFADTFVSFLFWEKKYSL